MEYKPHEVKCQHLEEVFKNLYVPSKFGYSLTYPVYFNGALRKIFGPKRNQVYEKLRNEKRDKFVYKYV